MKKLFLKIVIELWKLLPDKCEMPHCRRFGVRGNENVVDGMKMCDFCAYEYNRMYFIRNRRGAR